MIAALPLELHMGSMSNTCSNADALLGDSQRGEGGGHLQISGAGPFRTETSHLPSSLLSWRSSQRPSLKNLPSLPLSTTLPESLTSIYASILLHFGFSMRPMS